MEGLLDLPAWRRRILDRVLTWTAVVAAVPAMAGVWLSVEVGLWPLALVDGGAWVLLLGLAVRRDLPYGLRAGATLGIIGAVGAAVLAMTGPYGVGLLWLVAVPSLAGALGPPRAFWWAQAAVLGALVAIAAAVAWGELAWPEPPAPTVWWLMAWTSLLCVSLLVGLSTSTMMEGLQGSLRAQVAANEALQHEIRARQAAEAQREALQRQLVVAQQMEAVGRLASGFAHDLSNVLTVIRLEADTARHAGGPELERALDGLVQASDSAAGLCDEMLVFARRRPTVRVRLVLDEIVRKAEPMLSRLAGDHCRLVLALGVPGAVVLAEAAELERVLVNLVTNARDAMPEGGLVHLRTLPGDDGTVLVEVEDEGSG
ncbi:MAG: hypothetical protein R3F59_17945 [Myxococcota bacterium]